MIKDFFQKYKTQFIIFGVCAIVYFLYFHNLWGYHLLDVDETRYVDMSRYMYKTKNFMTLYLNGDYFFEKPPLYFWLENLSFIIFGKINEFTARIPGCIEAVLASVALFFTAKKYTKNIKFSAISGLILLSSIEFLILGKIAILDILLATMVTLSVLCGMMTFNTSDNTKKYYWWGFYLFSGLSVLAKGIPGIAIPFGFMFFACIYAKKFKEIFKPQYIIPGVLIFALVTLPWHIIMLNTYNPLFFNEYIMKHHVARFLGEEVIHRQQPFWFFIPVIICGIMPYAPSFIAYITEKCMKIKNIKNFKLPEFNQLDEKSQFIALSIIASLVIFIFFSSSGTKLITYILPIYPFLAVILGNYWFEYIEDNSHKKGIEISSLIFQYLFIIAGTGFFVTTFFLKEPIKSDFEMIRTPVLLTTLLFPALGIFAIKKGKRLLLFISFILFITSLSSFGLHKIMEMNYRFGENDLIEYAQFAKENNKNIYTFKTGARYSILYYSEKNAKFNIKKGEAKTILNNPNNILIVRKKHLKKLPIKKYTTIKTGRKYMLITQ